LISPEVFPPGSTHSTFSSNPLGTAVALEAVRMMEEEDYEEMTQRKAIFSGSNKRTPTALSESDRQYRWHGMALRIEICQEDGYEPDRALTDRIFAEE